MSDEAQDQPEQTLSDQQPYIPKRCPSCTGNRILVDGETWACGKCGRAGKVGETLKRGPRVAYAGKLRGKTLSASLTAECFLMLSALVARGVGKSQSEVVERSIRALYAVHAAPVAGVPEPVA